MDMRIINEADIDESLDGAIRAAACICFPSERDFFARNRAWHHSSPAYTVLLEDNDTIIAHGAVVDRTIRVGHEHLRVAGIQTVFVVPDHRGEGLSAQTMNAAMNEAARRGFDCGLLFCIPQIEKVYNQCGWIILPATTFTRIDDDGVEKPLPGKSIAMYYPLKRRDFPQGPIHLQGNDW